jgi:ketosteroid isomerase-like protein
MRIHIALLVVALCGTAFAQKGKCNEDSIRNPSQTERVLSDDVFFFSGALDKPVVGRSALSKQMQTVAAGREKENNASAKPEKVVVSQSGDMAYEYGTDHVTFDEKGTGKHNDFTAAYLRVWRAVDGQCKVAAVIYEPEGTK